MGENDLNKCVFCNGEFKELELIQIGKNKYACTGDFFNDILGYLSGNEASMIASRIQDIINNKYDINEVVRKVPEKIDTMWDGELILESYSKDNFVSRLKDDSYPPPEIVDFIGDDSTDDFNELMDYLIAITIISTDYEVFWEDVCKDLYEKYEWSY